MTKKGKQTLPYLLSTTKSLLKSKRYYYQLYDFRFQCKRNRDCYTERNVRINMTRMWHNIILPNAILCRESGFKPTFKDALDALNHAMTNGKTERSLAMWRQICQAEAALPKDQQVVYKYRRSFYYYVLGMAATKDGLIYNLPKKKVISLKDYVAKLSKFIYDTLPNKVMWRSPWDGLNELVYKWKHFDDEYNERVEARRKQINALRSKISCIWAWEADANERKAKLESEIEALEKEDYDDEAPEWPSTLRELCSTFHVSMTTAKQFKDWLKQYCKYNQSEYFGDYPKDVSWRFPKSVRDKNQDPKPETDMIDVDEHVDEGDDDVSDADGGIEHDIQSVVNSGVRPVGRVDDDDEISELPF